MVSAEQTIRKAYSKLADSDKCAFLSGLLFCLLFHFFAYTNTLFSHDAIPLYNQSDCISNGRFFLFFLFPIVANMNLPWVIGLLTCTFTGLVTALMARELKISNKMLIVLLAGIIAGYPPVITYHIYFSSAYIYMFATLMAILSVYLIDRYAILSVACMVISLGCYQAFIGLALALCIVKILLKLRDQETTFKSAAFLGLKYIFIMMISMIFYYAMWKLNLITMNMEMVSYRGYDNLTENMFSDIIQKFSKAYSWSLDILFKNYFALSSIGSAAFIILNILGIVLTVVFSKKRLLSLVLSLLLPLATMFIYVLNPAVPHLLMMFPTIIISLLFFSNIEHLINNTKYGAQASWIALIASSILIWQFAITSNTVYLQLKTGYDNSISYCTRLLDRIEQTDGFDEKVGIVIVGAEEKYGLYNRASWSSPITYCYAKSNGAITYPWTLKIFLQQELNTNLKISIDDGSYKYMEDVERLEPFPAKDCMTWVNGKLVVKISETSDAINTQ